MDDSYDVVICGTGLKECILSGILSSEGKKVLHLDRNGYYGGESASLNLTNLYEKFKSTSDVPKALGANRDWNVDLVPKFVMACGQLVKILIKTKVTRYLEWVAVEGSYVYQFQKSMFGSLTGTDKNIHKVPASDMEALKSPLMGIMEKNRCMKFFQFLAQFQRENGETHKEFDIQNDTMKDVYTHFGLADLTQEYLGHCVALEATEDYMTQPCGETLEKMVLYLYSVAKYGSSPYIYPLYGLGGLPEGFSRLAAVHGGTYMLNTPVHSFEYGADGRVSGVVAGEEGEKTTIKTKAVFCDPTYMDKKDLKEQKKVIRCVCILDSAPADINGRASCMMIIPSSQAKRKTDIYITVISSQHGVSAKGMYVACIATVCETDRPENEIKLAFESLPKPVEKFIQISPYYVPKNDPKKTGVYCSESYDETSHFETSTADVLDLYKQFTGKELDLDISADPENLQNE